LAKIESYSPGSFCWAELATSDAAAARKFYTEMFGWTPMDLPMPEGAYTIFQSEGNNAAAMYSAPPGTRPHWQVYFSVADADASAARVTPLGGKNIEGPFDVMQAGRMAVAQDPQGAYFSLWQPKTHIGAAHGGPLNHVCWVELMSPEPAAAVAFYSGLFGWKAKPETGFDKAEYIEWINGGSSFGGLMPMRGEMWKGIPPHWMIYVSVADCDERAARAKELGAQVRVSPTDIPKVGRFSVLTDAQGAVFSLFQFAGMPQPATT
jgi:uncharacterized protein